MIIKDIHWISKEAKEAELLVTDGQYVCFVFSQPCNFNRGDQLEDALRAFITEDLMLSYEDKVDIFRISDKSLSHRCIAEVVDEENSLVKIGEIYLFLDEKLPAGCSKGKLVEFNCSRIDAIE
jgi:hypothetical protein